MNMMIRIRKIGEISSPPKLGITERIGASTGSVIRNRNSATAATNWLRVLTTLKAISQDRIAEAIRSQTYRSRTIRTISRMARMAGWLFRFGRGFDQPLNIGSSLLKQGKFPANMAENRVFAFLTWH